ncbi:HK97 family phage prohead protease [Streptomyces sp. NPDC057686]|uniref:HK97 family phage prohead protease n=1 Tax=Streptomyces sp. NPDC057686 TaxID=3346212 RepID=UPI00368E8EA3
MERKSSQSASMKSGNAGAGLAVFSRFGGPPDSDNDITLPTAFTDGQEVAMSAYNHGSWNPGIMPIGKGIIRVESDRALFDFQLFTDTSAGAEAYTVMKRLGPLVELSYGFDVLESEPGTWQGSPVRILKRLRTFEISPVLVGAGRQTELLSLKSDRRSSASSQRAELQRIKDVLQRRQLEDIRDHLRDEQRREEMAAVLWDAKQAFLKVTGIPYSRDAEWLVPEEVRDAAQAAIGVYAPQLGLDRENIKIVWFSAEDDTGASKPGEFADFYAEKPLLGKCHPETQPNVIYLNSSLSSDEAWSVAAHELKHLQGGDEGAAMLYESKALLERMGY